MNKFKVGDYVMYAGVWCGSIKKVIAVSIQNKPIKMANMTFGNMVECLDLVDIKTGETKKEFPTVQCEKKVFRQATVLDYIRTLDAERRAKIMSSKCPNFCCYSCCADEDDRSMVDVCVKGITDWLNQLLTDGIIKQLCGEEKTDFENETAELKTRLQNAENGIAHFDKDGRISYIFPDGEWKPQAAYANKKVKVVFEEW